jgi:PAS domain S-box-containing protein
MIDLKKLSKSELIARIEKMQKAQQSTKVPKEYEPLLLKIAANYPNSYISIIEKDLTIGFTSGQEIKNQNLDPKTFIGLSLEQLFGEHAPFVKEHYLKTFAGKEQSFELIINDQYQLYKTVPLENKDGLIDRILSVVENVTMRKQTEKKLQESEEQFHQLFEKHDAVMLLIEPETGKIIDANLSAQNFYGYPDGTLKQLTIQDINSLPEEKVLELRKQAQKENQNYFVFPHCLASGEIRTVEVHSSPIIINKKQILFSIIHDITDRIQAEEKLKESEKHFRAIYNNTPTMLHSLDKNGLLISISDFWLKTLGYEKSEVLGKPSTMFLTENSKRYAKDIAFPKFHENDFITNAPYQFVKKNGEVIDVLLSAIAIRDSSGEMNRTLAVLMDITDHKLADKALHDSEERFELAMTATRDGLYDWNLETNEIYYSPRWKSMLGYKDDELPNDFSVWEKLIKAKDAEKSWEMQQELINKQRDRFELEFKMKHKEGHFIEILSRAEAVFDENGKAIRIVGTHVDISERKKVEEELRHNRILLRNVLDIVPAFICAKNLDGKFIIVNKKLSDFYGSTVEAMTNVNHSHLCEDKNELRAMLAADRKVIESGKPKFIPEETMESPDGSIIVLETYKIPFTALGEAAVLIASNDITERKRAEEALRENHARHAAMIANISDVIGIIDADGMIKYQSPNIERWFGWTPEDLIGTNGWDKVHPEDIERVQKEFSKILEHNNTSTIEFRFKCKEDKYKWIELTAVNRINEPEINGVLLNYHDITERKKVEKEKEKIFNSIQTAIYIYDFVKSKNDFINPEYTKLLGWTLDEINNMGNKFTELFHPDDFKQVVEHMQIVNEDTEDNTHIQEYRFKHKNGQWRWCLSYDTPFQRKVNGDVEKMIGSFIDITERKQAEEAIRKQKNMFELVINSVPSRIFWKDLNSVYLGCNISFMEAVRKNKIEDVIGKNDFDLIWGQEAEKYINDDKEIIKKGMPKLGYEEYYILPDGKKIWWQSSKMPLKDNTGKIIGILATSEDITERKQADKDLKESEKKYKELSENSPLAIYLTDKNGKCIYVNPKWLLLSGMDYNDAIGDGWRNAICQEDREVVFNNWDNYVNKKTKWGYEYRFQHKNGSITWVYGTGVTLFDEKGEITGYLGTNLDISEHKLAEEELAKYRGNLEELVNERTLELEGANKDLLIKNKELERFNDLFADREFRIKELREKVKELENKNG